MVDIQGTADISVPEIEAFLAQTQPFNEFDARKLHDLALAFQVVQFAPQTVVFRQDIDEVDNFFLVYEGGVKTYLTGSDKSFTLLDFRHVGGYFGALAIIRGSKANFNVETVEQTVCLSLDKRVFMHLIDTFPQFSTYYLKTLSEDLVGTAFAELRERKISSRPQEMLYLFNRQIGEVIRRRPEIIHASRSVREAAERMSDLEIGSLLVQGQDGSIVGILTDKDLRKKVLAQGRSHSEAVESVMSSPVKTIHSGSLCFDALVMMMHERVQHLVVERGKEIVGVVSTSDLMAQAGSSPLHLFREIENQVKIEDLYSLSQQIPRVVRSLVEEGARANNVTRIITMLNDKIVSRLLSLLDDKMGPAPHPYCWISLGSEGRREQTFKTDQDNAIIYGTPEEDWEQIKSAKIYFRRFGNEAINHLERCGYPLCKGKMMASNPRWRKPYDIWKEYFDRWMRTPEPEEVLHSTIFFDFRPVHGQEEFAEDLRNYLAVEAPQRGIFLHHLAKDCLSVKSPLTIFRNFVVEKEGKYKNRIDLKSQGLVPFVDFARLMALRYGLKETNTFARLEALLEHEHIPRQLFSDTRQAYEFQMQLRLVNQLRMMEAKQVPHNYIDPADLSELEKQTLKEIFSLIPEMQSYIKLEFGLGE